MHAFLCPSNFIDLAFVIGTAILLVLNLIEFAVDFNSNRFALTVCLSFYRSDLFFMWKWGDLGNHQEIATIAMGNKHFCNTGCYQVY